MKHAVAVALSLFVAVSAFAADAVFYASGPRGKKQVALTFDDGPGPFTDQVLAVLKRYNVQATFFLDASQVEMRPALAKKTAEAGHEIANHLYHHTDFYHYKKPDAAEALRKEIDLSEKIIQKATGMRTVLLRMPHGYNKIWSRDIAREKNYTMINWTFGSDWLKMDGEKLAQLYIRNIGPGAILLMHDGGRGRERTVALLPKLIEEIKARGYEIVTVSELLELQPSAIALKNKNKAGK